MTNFTYTQGVNTKNLINKFLTAKISKIKLLICDVDGVLTDGKLYWSEKGDEIKVFNAQDGEGMKRLQNAGVPIAIITGSNSPAVRKRMEFLKIQHLFMNDTNKLPIFEKLIQELDIKKEEVAYIGDDLPDIAILKEIGFAVAVQNAVNDVKNVADYITSKNGGDGAVREICDLIMKAQNLYKI